MKIENLTTNLHFSFFNLQTSYSSFNLGKLVNILSAKVLGITEKRLQKREVTFSDVVLAVVDVSLLN